MAVLPADAASPIVTEGHASVYLPPSVFYNPVQEFNRDLTIAVITEHVRAFSCSDKRKLPKQGDCPSDNATSENKPGDDDYDSAEGNPENKTHIAKPNTCSNGVRILEGLAASGLRSVRFALEIPFVREVVANDFDLTAVDYIRHNATHNNVAHLITASCSDAAMLMYASRSRSDRFDVVDLDPYGSPAPFLDSAVQCVSEGGLLCVTCTDMAVLCGNAAETCLAKYGSVSLRAPYCHEMALRIILQSVARHAARYQRFIEPLLSISADFYVRVFVRIRTGQNRVKELSTKLANVYHCRSCGAFSLQALMVKSRNIYSVGSGPPVGQKCDHCGGRHAFCGPIWSDAIHDVDFVRRVRSSVLNDDNLFPNTRQRIDGILSVVSEELQDQPLYYVGDALCSVLHCTSPGFIPLRYIYIIDIPSIVTLFSLLLQYAFTLLPLIFISYSWYAVAEWYGAGLAITRSLVRISPTAAVYQRQLSVPSLRGRLMGTSGSWGVNGHTT